MAVHNAFKLDRLQTDGQDTAYRVIGHSDVTKATVWRFVKDQGRVVLQMYRNGDVTTAHSGVGYLTVAVHDRTNPPPRQGVSDLAVTFDPSLASTVRVGAFHDHSWRVYRS